MLTAELGELRKRLANYLTRVKKGEEVLIVQNGKPVARIVKECPSEPSTQGQLASLAAAGLVLLPSRDLDRRLHTPHKLSAKLVSEAVCEDRR